jgi:hypothetical protein
VGVGLAHGTDRRRFLAVLGMTRQRLQLAAVQIAANYHKPASGPRRALRNLFIARRYRDHVPVGWKRGELAELFGARTRAEFCEEWGDVGYYVAQTWGWLWWLYEAVTPEPIIAWAVEKFEARAQRRQP